MSNILFAYENEVPTVSMMREMFSSIDDNFGFISIFSSIQKIDENVINTSDVIVLVRATDPLSVDLAKAAQKAHKFIVAYYDDDLMNRPYDRPIISWRRGNVRRILELADLVLTSNSRIGEKYKNFTRSKRFVQMHTIVQKSELRSTRKEQSSTVRILYAANPSHVVLIDRFIKPAIKELSDINYNISFHFLGVHPLFEKDDLPHNLQVEYIPTMPFKDYRNYMSLHDFDIGLAPIFEDEFSKCKYINKFIEYGIFEIAGIFTNSEPYTDVVISDSNGLLVKNDPVEWSMALRSLIEDRQRRDRLGHNALETIKMNFSQEAILTRLIDQIPELVSYKSPNISIKWGFIPGIKYRVYRGEELFYLAFKYLTNKGISGLNEKIKNHVSEHNSFNGGSKA